jgi:hypothetical protein
MSMLRKTTITVAIVGAGLGSLTGAAFANTTHHGSSHDSHGRSASCSNNIRALNSSQGGGFADVAGGAQTVGAANVCHILNDNKVLNGNVLNIGGTTTTLPTLPGIPGI